MDFPQAASGTTHGSDPRLALCCGAGGKAATDKGGAGDHPLSASGRGVAARQVGNFPNGEEDRAWTASATLPAGPGPGTTAETTGCVPQLRKFHDGKRRALGVRLLRHGSRQTPPPEAGGKHWQDRQIAEDGGGQAMSEAFYEHY